MSESGKAMGAALTIVVLFLGTLTWIMGIKFLLSFLLFLGTLLLSIAGVIVVFLVVLWVWGLLGRTPLEMLFFAIGLVPPRRKDAG